MNPDIILRSLHAAKAAQPYFFELVSLALVTLVTKPKRMILNDPQVADLRLREYVRVRHDHK